jgi:hypothetical protein
MPPPPCSTPLHDTLERAACRVAQTEALLRRAAATRTLAWAALERSQHLLAQLERSQAGDLPDPMRAVAIAIADGQNVTVAWVP